MPGTHATGSAAPARAAPFRLVVLVSGNGSNLQAFIDRVADGSLPATIAAVVSNKPDVHALERARRAGIDTAVVDHRAYASRDAFDRALAARIDAYRPDLVILAGFMRILTPAFVHHYAGRLLNVHPSLLPKFTGMDTHARAIAAGETEHGCSVHFVTEELDGGPVVAQACVPVHPDDTPDTLRARVQHAEHRLYPLVAGWLASGRLRLAAHGVTLDGAPLTEPVRNP
ncbi:MAG: phosphoribosylglycinamide formyltransferase [Gammaproteobacteria bacterium]